jgi:hypothetical protein
MLPKRWWRPVIPRMYYPASAVRGHAAAGDSDDEDEASRGEARARRVSTLMAADLGSAASALAARAGAGGGAPHSSALLARMAVRRLASAGVSDAHRSAAAVGAARAAAALAGAQLGAPAAQLAFTGAAADDEGRTFTALVSSAGAR